MKYINGVAGILCFILGLYQENTIILDFGLFNMIAWMHQDIVEKLES